MANKTSFDTTIDIGAKGVDEAVKKLKHLYKEANKVSQGWKQASKFSQVHIDEIDNLSTVMGKFTGKLSSEAKKSVEGLKNLSDQLKDAKSDAEALSQIAASAGKKGDTGIQAEAQSKLNEVIKSIGGLNSQIKKQLADQKAYGKEIYKTTEAQKNMRERLEGLSKYKPGEAVKDFVNSLKSGNFKGAAGAAGRGAAGAVARPGLTKMAAGQDPGVIVKSLGKAAGMLSLVGIALSGLVAFIQKASGSIAAMNKALLEGSTLAGDAALSAGEYKSSIDSIRNSAVKTNQVMQQYGEKGEKSLKIVAAFSKEASGSIQKTAIQLKEMGEGSMDGGLSSFAESAVVYGKALGMEAEEVASTMGQFVSEVGYGADNVQSTMGAIAKAATTSGMPVQKFMGIFKQVTPDLDLYINRLEELTGIMKLLSKNMSPGDVQKFMQAFSKGFDQMDFKQRLKMAFVIGPGKVNKALAKDFARTGDAIADQLGKSVGGAKLADEFKKAINSADPVGETRKVMGKAMAQGVTPATIGAAQKLARSQSSLNKGKKGDVLQTATAMRGAGMYARMSMVEDYAGKFTGGDITGLGEHVAKQLGVSESEYAAILQLQDSMGDYQAQLSKVGRTSDKHINDNLKKILRQDKKMVGDSDEEFEKVMKEQSSKDPSGVTDMIKQAASMNIEQTEEEKESLEDLAKQQWNVSSSIDEKITSVLGMWLEKVFNAVNESIDWLGGIVIDIGKSMGVGLIDNSSEVAGWLKKNSDTFAKNFSQNKEGLEKYKEINNNLAKMVKSGSSTIDILNDSSSILMDMHQLSDEELTTQLKPNLGEDDTKDFIKALREGDTAKTDELLKGLNSGNAAGLVSKIAYKTMGKNVKTEPGFAKKQTEKETKKGEVDERTKKLYEDADNMTSSTGEPVRTGTTAVEHIGRGTEPVRTGTTTVEHMRGSAGTNQGQLEDLSKSNESSEATLTEMADGGIKLDNAWMKSKFEKTSTNAFSDALNDSKFKNTLKETTLDSFRKALLEFAIIQAKISEDSKFGSNLANYGSDAMGAGGNLSTFSNFSDTGAMEKWFDSKNIEGKGVFGSFASGGEVPRTGLYKLHAGESVSSPAATRGGGGSTSVVININGTSLNEDQLKRATLNAMDEYHRKQTH